MFYLFSTYAASTYIFVFSALELIGFWFVVDAFCDPIRHCFDYKGFEGLGFICIARPVSCTLTIVSHGQNPISIGCCWCILDRTGKVSRAKAFEPCAQWLCHHSLRGWGMDDIRSFWLRATGKFQSVCLAYWLHNPIVQTNNEVFNYQFSDPFRSFQASSHGRKEKNCKFSGFHFLRLSIFWCFFEHHFVNAPPKGGPRIAEASAIHRLAANGGHILCGSRQKDSAI